MKKDYNYSKVPYGYAHCFNASCPSARKCIRHLLTEIIPDDTLCVTALSPRRTGTGKDCRYFAPDNEVVYAKGFTHLLEQLTALQAEEVRMQLTEHYGKTKYYRLRNGKLRLSPEMQEHIGQVLARCGIKTRLQFDVLETDYRW